MLSPQNRALVMRALGRMEISPQMADYLIEHWGQANMLLNAARAGEWRPDREAIARVIDPLRGWNGYGWTSGTEEREEDERKKLVALAKADEILALPPPTETEKEHIR